MPDRNILDELMKLLNQPGPVNWALAGQVAGHLSGPTEPIDPWLAEEYLDLTRLAQLRIPETTGLPSDPMTRTILVDRAGWADHHLRSFRYLVEPLAAKLATAPGSGPLDAILKPLGPAPARHADGRHGRHDERGRTRAVRYRAPHRRTGRAHLPGDQHRGLRNRARTRFPPGPVVVGAP